MTNHQLLNHQTHSDYRIIADRSAQLGDSIMHAMVFSRELRSLQAHYPIFFCKDSDTGNFYPAALFGLEQGENLFLKNSGWSAGYVPMMVERQPFLIGFQSSDGAHNEAREPVVSIDMDSPRVSQETGHRLFNDDNKPSEFLQQSVEVLDAIHRGHKDNENLIAALLEHQLIESCSMEVGLADGSKRKLLGYYTINENTLRELSSDALSELHGSGHLEAIYMMIAALTNMASLIEKKNALLDPPIPAK